MVKGTYFKRLTVILIVIIFISFAYSVLIPDISRLKKENPRKTALMEYREGEWKEKGKKYRIYQQWAPLSQVSPYLIRAVLIAEDDKFWRHEGLITRRYRKR